MAEVGDQIHVRSYTVDAPDRLGEIIEVRGDNGAPPYLVRFRNGHESIVYPGADTTIESLGARTSPQN